MGRVSVGAEFPRGRIKGSIEAGRWFRSAGVRTRMAAAPIRTLRRLFPLLSGAVCVLFIAVTPLLARGPTHRRLQL